MSDPSASVPRPCVFAAGPYKGYIASATRLKNGLVDKGECAVNDQINPLQVNGITIRWGQNYLRQAGVQIGDLAIVTWKAVDGQLRRETAVVIDSGGSAPAMGTVALNAALLGRRTPVSTSEQARSLAIATPATVTIIPGSAGYALVRPFNNANITLRVAALAAAGGFPSIEALEARVRVCARTGR